MTNSKNINKMENQMNIKEVYGTFNNKNQIVNDVAGDGYTRNSQFNCNGVYCYMMEVADNQGNFVSSILERAVNGLSVSQKQAWCVAFFAEKNGFVA